MKTKQILTIILLHGIFILLISTSATATDVQKSEVASTPIPSITPPDDQRNQISIQTDKDVRALTYAPSQSNYQWVDAVLTTADSYIQAEHHYIMGGHGQIGTANPWHYVTTNVNNYCHTYPNRGLCTQHRHFDCVGMVWKAFQEAGFSDRLSDHETWTVQNLFNYWKTNYPDQIHYDYYWSGRQPGDVVIVHNGVHVGILATNDNVANAAGNYCSSPSGCNGSGVKYTPLSNFQSTFVAYLDVEPNDLVRDTTPPPQSGHFSDVPIDYPHYGYIEALRSFGAISGYSDGTYHPEEYATRGAVAKIIILSIGQDETYNDGATVCNVSPSHTFYPYIRRMLELGISTCPSDGNWKPDDFLSRGGLAKFVVLARGEGEPQYSTCQQPYPDVPCSHTFYKYIRRLKEIFVPKGIQLGYSDGTFHPDESITRAGVAKFVIVGLDLENTIPTFFDVLFDNDFYAYIEGIAEKGITSGCSSTPPRFCPEDGLTRGGAAKFIIRAMGEDPYYTDGIWPFSDVSPSHTFYNFIRRLKEWGITTGYSDGTYKPDANITRGEMAKFIVQGLESRGVTCQYGQSQAFSDVPPSHTFYDEIQCLKELGISSGFSDGTFRPDDQLTRAGAAKFVYLAFVQRAPTIPQELSNSTNNSCNSSSPMYLYWDRYVVPSGDTDCFKLPVSIPANHVAITESEAYEYHIATNNVGINADVKVEVVATNGSTVLASTAGKGQNGGVALLWTPPGSGTYYVRLTNTNSYAKEGTQVFVTAEQRLPPDSEMVGYWSFNEDTGSIAFDATDNYNNGNIYNATWVEGKQGTALHFDGAGDYVHISDSPSLDLSSKMTIVAWVKPDSICTQGYGNNPIVQKDESYGLKAVSTGQSLGFIWSGFEAHKSTTRLLPGQWYHLVATFNNGTHRIFVNGEPENEGFDSVTQIPITTKPVYIAKGVYACDFNGTIDEVRIYKGAFSELQIHNLYIDSIVIGKEKIYLPFVLRHFYK